MECRFYEVYFWLKRSNDGSDNAVDLSFEWDPTEPIAIRNSTPPSPNASSNSNDSRRFCEKDAKSRSANSRNDAKVSCLNPENDAT